eukprot:Plantae.Rhodophyta-Purpureofilum_apyrenoidigerum.ctg108899.p2 GENE.Plantae.Rhodophyta-Purpureofilum_apyrenoidigerum.ctg108899~~Plantae.Rhodophyta-Purpureofilum_apyrenoidigerum.ctg108899.p2  ORF type:complete len:109 (-),score=8.65 Plantae.Rhodophyta-Purpureofilum_apyrenoidigerum.ctg108899:13-339(-)
MSQSQRTASSRAFFSRPFFLFKNVTCLFFASCIFSMTIFLLPISLSQHASTALLSEYALCSLFSSFDYGVLTDLALHSLSLTVPPSLLSRSPTLRPLFVFLYNSPRHP